MDRITVSSAVAERLRRFPKRVYLCDEAGNAPWFIERLDPPDELGDDQTLSVAEIQITLHDIFDKT